MAQQPQQKDILGGIPSPNPSYPQQINNVEGIITITKSNSDNTQSKTYNFPLSEGQKLMQDGTIENKVVNIHKQIVFDGSEDENWVMAGTYALKIDIPDKSSKNIGFCNKFIRTGSWSSGNTLYRGKYNMTDGTLLKIMPLDDSINSPGSWKTWLSNNPITVEYELATPDETAFTSAQQSVINEIINDGTYKEVTHYTAEASLNPDMEIGYYKDLETLVNKIENIDSRLSLLE